MPLGCRRSQGAWSSRAAQPGRCRSGRPAGELLPPALADLPRCHPAMTACLWVPCMGKAAWRMFFNVSKAKGARLPNAMGASNAATPRRRQQLDAPVTQCACSCELVCILPVHLSCDANANVSHWACLQDSNLSVPENELCTLTMRLQ